MSVSEVQRALVALGYSAGVPNGSMGKKTVDALRAFQRDNKLYQSAVKPRPIALVQSTQSQRRRNCAGI